MTEHDIQVAVFNRIKSKALTNDDYKFIFAIPNGGKRDVRVAKNLKAEGVLAGVSDICIPLPKYGYHGAYIEVKTGKGRATANQKEFQLAMSERGYFCAVTKGLDETWSTIESYIEEIDTASVFMEAFLSTTSPQK